MNIPPARIETDSIKALEAELRSTAAEVVQRAAELATTAKRMCAKVRDSKRFERKDDDCTCRLRRPTKNDAGEVRRPSRVDRS